MELLLKIVAAEKSGLISGAMDTAALSSRIESLQFVFLFLHVEQETNVETSSRNGEVKQDVELAETAQKDSKTSGSEYEIMAQLTEITKELDSTLQVRERGNAPSRIGQDLKSLSQHEIENLILQEHSSISPSVGSRQSFESLGQLKQAWNRKSSDWVAQVNSIPLRKHSTDYNLYAKYQLIIINIQSRPKNKKIQPLASCLTLFPVFHCAGERNKRL